MTACPGIRLRCHPYLDDVGYKGPDSGTRLHLEYFFQVFWDALSLITRMTEQRFDIQNQIQKKGENR